VKSQINQKKKKIKRRNQLKIRNSRKKGVNKKRKKVSCYSRNLKHSKNIKVNNNNQKKNRRKKRALVMLVSYHRRSI
jgi:hypothetical protein